MEKILVCGGAGYIGSVCVHQLIDAGYKPIVVDNLSKGKIELLPKNTIFYQIDLTDKESLEKVFKEHQFDKIIHFAAYKAVGESMTNAPKYSQNITGMINLLDLMVKHKTKKIIFSSSAAVYGIPNNKIIIEEEITNPINYYGFTKLEMENIIKWYNKIHDIKYISLRYFNVAGDVLKYIDPEAQNIFPIIMEVIKKNRTHLTIFGDDYDTKDGTCVRDYIDVEDLSQAHILALNSNFTGIINLGTGKGHSVQEIVDKFKKLANFKVEIGPRRAGDPAYLVASNERAKTILNWKPKNDIDHMIKTTYDAYLG
jgi:UDP-glucose 4-epimerase